VSATFPEALLLVGLLLVAAAAFSGWLHVTVLSISVLSVAAGITLAELDVVTADPGSPIVTHVVELALILTLFSDGMLVERELLLNHWGPAARALVIAMPVTLVLLALGGKGLFPDLTWAEAFLLAAVLTPTDPVVTSAVVSSKRVPAMIRHTLNLESGLNDGLALPFVLFFLTLASPGGSAAHEGFKVLGEVGVGALIGVALGLGGGWITRHLPSGGPTRSYQGVYALGLALAAFGLADVTYGNGLIAAFVAGIAIAFADHRAPESYGPFSENLGAVLQVGTFFLFGALIVATGFNYGVAALVGFILFALLVARPLAVLGSFAGSKLPRAQKLFIAWFGPKGVASMLFALLVLNSVEPNRALVFDVASFVILASIVAHGLTDTIGARWVERQLEPDDARGAQI
jgi:NhaP-type Na+/H+ or K+/H+ antiporter